MSDKPKYICSICGKLHNDYDEYLECCFDNKIDSARRIDSKTMNKRIIR